MVNPQDVARSIDSFFLSIDPYVRIYAFALATTLIVLTSYTVFNAQYVFYWYFQIPFFEQYKIQKDVKYTKEVYLKAFKVAFFNLLMLAPSLLASALVMPSALKFTVPAPTWPVFLLSLAFCQFSEDITFYFSHRLLHSVPWLYKNIHKQHHEFSAPIGMSAAYAGLTEFFLGNVVQAISGPIILQSHIIVLWTWLIIRLWYTVDVHCGYAFPWGLEAFVGKIYAGPRHHDRHHAKFAVNYSSTLTYLDVIFGTDKFKRSKVHELEVSTPMGPGPPPKKHA